ncbi:MAG: SOS response-associated peptidase [Planctomycetota bacterium]|jgi:putative SOS response-associated peptidase YedK
MCGRYTLATPDPDLADLLDLTAEPTLEPRYNIAPTQPVAVLRTPQVRPVRELELLQWGLVPSWAKDPTIGARMINARSETAAEKPSFRAAFRQRRCLLPADGFYEWQRIGRGKQPHYIRMKGGRPFVFAGLWEHWEGPDGTVIESLWLDPEVKDPARIQPLLRPYEAAEMTSHPVSTQVNNPRNDEGGCIQPL